MPSGGVATIENIVIEKGPNSQNDAFIHYGGDMPTAAPNSSLTINGNTVIDDKASNQGPFVFDQTVVTNGGPIVVPTINGNTFYGPGPDNLLAGPGFFDVQPGAPYAPINTFLPINEAPTLDTSPPTALAIKPPSSSLAEGNSGSAGAGDTTVEPNEQFKVTQSAPTGALITTASATGTAIFATVLGAGGSTVTIPFATATNAAAAQIALDSISDAVRAGTLAQLNFDGPPWPAAATPQIGLVELNSSTVPLPGLALGNNAVSAVLDGASQQVAMTGLLGNNTVVAGRGGAVIGNIGPNNKIFFGGGGVQQFSEVDLAQFGIVSSAEVWLDGDATFDDSAGSTLIHLGTVSGGAGAVAMRLAVTDNGAGTTTIDVASDTTGTAASDFITFEGIGSAATTVNAAGGTDSLGAATGGVPLSAFVGTDSAFTNGNGSNVSLNDKAGAVTLLGGAGSDTVAGATGLIEAGTRGGSMLFGGTVPGATTLIGGGEGDFLSSGARNTLMIAGRGNETLTASQPSTFRGIGGPQAPGAMTLFQAQTGGNTYLLGNGQTSIASTTDANGGNLFQEGVSSSANTATISGFVSGVDSISGANPAGGQYALVTDRAPGPQEMSLSVNGAMSTLTFDDGTTWTFNSVVQLEDFVNIALRGGI
jgi:hypothetical protein